MGYDPAKQRDYNVHQSKPCIILKVIKMGYLFPAVSSHVSILALGLESEIVLSLVQKLEAEFRARNSSKTGKCANTLLSFVHSASELPLWRLGYLSRVEVHGWSPWAVITNSSLECFLINSTCRGWSFQKVGCDLLYHGSIPSDPEVTSLLLLEGHWGSGGIEDSICPLLAQVVNFKPFPASETSKGTRISFRASLMRLYSHQSSLMPS